jgi:uncharacterized protein YqjF (DUF2071 family)
VVARDRGIRKPGVYFFSLDAANPVAVETARRWFLLPYFHAAMSCFHAGERIRYRSERTHRGARQARFVATYGPAGPVAAARAGSVEHWLTERYCLYTANARGEQFIGEIHHEPWPLQPAEARIEENTMAHAAGVVLPDEAPLLHFARAIDVAIWRLRRVEP